MKITGTFVTTVAQSVVHYYLRKYPSMAKRHLADIHQEAALTILQVGRTFREPKCPPGADPEAFVLDAYKNYAARAAHIAVRRYFWRNKFAVQIPRSLAEDSTLEIPTTELDAPKPDGEAPTQIQGGETPFEVYARLQLRMRLSNVLQAAVTGDAEAALGLKRAREEESPAEFSERHKLPVKQVYAASAALRRAVKSSDAATKLWQEL